MEKSLIRIFSVKGVVVGVGFLVGDDEVVTCAHVIRDALALPEIPSEKPTQEIQLDFPFINPKKKVQAEIVQWHPRRPGGGGDIAGLRIKGYLPNTSAPVELISEQAENLKHHRFRVYGFPMGYDIGIWSYGTVKEARTDKTIQIEDEKSSGQRIEGGFSGTPVWDEILGKVIGMITTADNSDPPTKVAFMIPISEIVSIWPGIRQRPVQNLMVVIPIVLVVMNKHQAYTLVQAQDFQEFKKLLPEPEENIHQWLSHYSDDRKDWQPHYLTPVTSESSIESSSIYRLVWKRVDEVNKANSVKEKEKFRRIHPQFISEELFDENNEDKRTKICTYIQKLGGIMIVDTVSLFHVDIQKIFSELFFRFDEKVAILSITTMSHQAIKDQNFIEDYTKKLIGNHAFQRFKEPSDSSCELGVSNFYTIKRWLSNVLFQKTKDLSIDAPNPDMIELLQNQIGKDPEQESVFYGSFVTGDIPE